MLYSKTKSFSLQTVSTLDRTTNINNTLSISRVTHIFVTVTTRFSPFMATVFFPSWTFFWNWCSFSGGVELQSKIIDSRKYKCLRDKEQNITEFATFPVPGGQLLYGRSIRIPTTLQVNGGGGGREEIKVRLTYCIYIYLSIPI